MDKRPEPPQKGELLLAEQRDIGHGLCARYDGEQAQQQ